MVTDFDETDTNTAPDIIKLQLELQRAGECFFSSKKWSWKTNDETEKMTILSKKHQCINTFSTHLSETTPEKVTNEVFELFLLTGGTVKIESDE